VLKVYPISFAAENQLQIFNLELRAKMKSYAMPTPVQFWKWTSPNNIALVTATSVFHWSIEGLHIFRSLYAIQLMMRLQARLPP
jgi:hypothetical protein